MRWELQWWHAETLVCHNIVLTMQAYEEDHKAACGHMHWHTNTTMSKFKWKGLHICRVMQQSNMNIFIKHSETVWFGSPFRYSSQRDCPESGVSIEAIQSSKWGCRMCRAILRRQLMGQSFVKSLGFLPVPTYLKKHKNPQHTIVVQFGDIVFILMLPKKITRRMTFTWFFFPIYLMIFSIIQSLGIDACQVLQDGQRVNLIHLSITKDISRDF